MIGNKSTAEIAEYLYEKMGLEPVLINNSGIIFFKPDMTMVDWLKAYAGERLICDVGSGAGHLLRMLTSRGARCFGIEPTWDHLAEVKDALENERPFLQVMPFEVQRTKMLEQMSPKNCLVVFARPCHSAFVEDALDMLQPGVEALYITKKENFNGHDDLGKYKDRATIIKHLGTSKDNEVVYSIIK